MRYLLFFLLTATLVFAQTPMARVCVIDDAGGDDAYSGSCVTGVTRVILTVTTANTGAATLDTGTGAAAIYCGGTANCADGTIAVGRPVELQLRSAVWQVIGPYYSTGGGSSSIIDETYVEEREEFWQGSNGSSQIGKLGWASTGTLAGLQAEANHPGMYRATTGTTANNQAVLYLNGTSGFRSLPALNAVANWQMEWIFRTGATITEAKYRIGLVAANTVDQAVPSSGMFLDYVSSTGCTANGTDTTWMFSRGGSTRAAGPAIAVDTWYKVRIRSTVSGEIRMAVASAGGSYGTEEVYTTVLPTAILQPFFQVVTCDPTPATAARRIDVDYWRVYWTGLTR